MGKPTSLASQVTRQAAEKKLVEAAEDKALASASVPVGMVRVRLRRPFYDSQRKYHPKGVALLAENEVPSTAMVLTKGVAKASADDDES